MCGGTAAIEWEHPLDKGLSPRVRGNHGYYNVVATSLRSIPACAGEPPGVRLPQARIRVYPRVCGGTTRFGRLMEESKGLSPRVRGNHRHLVTMDGRTRSIPACAGEPTCRRGRLVASGVYPRVCGGTILGS